MTKISKLPRSPNAVFQIDGDRHRAGSQLVKHLRTACILARHTSCMPDSSEDINTNRCSRLISPYRFEACITVFVACLHPSSGTVELALLAGTDGWQLQPGANSDPGAVVTR